MAGRDSRLHYFRLFEAGNASASPHGIMRKKKSPLPHELLKNIFVKDPCYNSSFLMNQMTSDCDRNRH